MVFESGVIGHLMGSYDGGGPGHQWGLERCDIVGHDARIVITKALSEWMVTKPHAEAHLIDYRD